MTVKSAQLTLLGISLLSIFAVALVFITGRLWHFPLDYAAQEEIPLIQLTLPPFFGVIGSAAQFLESPGRVKVRPQHRQLLRVLVLAPGLLFLVLFAILTIVFHIANQPGSEVHFGLDSYRLWLTILLSMVLVSVPVIGSTVFRKNDKA